MQFRIIKCGDLYELEATFGISWVGRLLGGKQKWYWINTYPNLESARRGRDYLIQDETGVKEVIE